MPQRGNRVANQSSSDWAMLPTSTNPAAYHPDLTWRDLLRQRGVICASCDAIRPERLSDVDQVVVREVRPVGGHFGAIWDIGYVGTLSEKVVRLIGRERLLGVGRLVPIQDASGRALKAHVALIGWHRGALRSRDAAHPTVCGECGRLHYWPGWPPENWRLLRQEWMPKDGLAFVDDVLLCSDALWTVVTERAKLADVRADRIPIVEEPTDGLPADYDEMVAEVRRRGWIT